MYDQEKWQEITETLEEMDSEELLQEREMIMKESERFGRGTEIDRALDYIEELLGGGRH